MRLFRAMFTAMVLLASVSAEAQTLAITRGGSRNVQPAPAENFTGGVRVESLFEALDPSHASGGSVTFEPGARTVWHSHPRGQVLIITAGTGRVQHWGHPIEEVRSGDVVRIPAGAKHWHGASPNASMTHIAITEHLDGARVQWMERVSDEQYNSSVRREQPQGNNRLSGPVQQKIAPGLATLTDDVLFGDVWNRPELSPRDRSLVTISALIATGKSAQLVGHLGRALDNGIQPTEASGLLAHLAVYSGWPNAVSALNIYEQVYTARKIDPTALRDVRPPLPVPASDAPRARSMNEEFGMIAPKFVQLTNDVVFNDLWRRSDLSPRDRSLATIAALAAMGDDGQLDVYLRRAIESGLTRAQISEALTHLGFYAGWPKAMKAISASARTLGK
jgi:4-carboxymuconolactone decarboxylase